MTAPSIKENRWRKGGMTSNGLRDSSNVVNYFYGAGRMNIIPNATAKQTESVLSDPVSSIGIFQNNGLGQVAGSSSYGPGTLKSTNIQIRNPAVSGENTFGTVIQNNKRSQFVDYRSTDPALIQNLRKNPLSIYVVGDAKDADIPAFYSYIRPDNYNTYKTIQSVDIDHSTTLQGIDGSPQINILGLNKQNPFMGLTSVVNDTPEFNGKTYGGSNDSSAKPFAEQLYNQVWTTNTLKPVSVQNSSNKEFFGNGHNQKCKNPALIQFAQGYNVAPQINQNKMITWVSDTSHIPTNLPWGPKNITNNPQTQEGGIWTKGNNPNPTVPSQMGYQNTRKPAKSFKGQHKQPNCYADGLPGSLVCN